MFLTIFMSIVDTISSFDAPPLGDVITGQTARCRLRRLGCVERSGTDISHTLSFYFPNIIGLVQRIVRFVMCTEPKASYRTVQYEYAYRYTPNIYSFKLCHLLSLWSQCLKCSFRFGLSWPLRVKSPNVVWDFFCPVFFFFISYCLPLPLCSLWNPISAT